LSHSIEHQGGGTKVYLQCTGECKKQCELKKNKKNQGPGTLQRKTTTQRSNPARPIRKREKSGCRDLDTNPPQNQTGLNQMMKNVGGFFGRHQKGVVSHSRSLHTGGKANVDESRTQLVTPNRPGNRSRGGEEKKKTTTNNFLWTGSFRDEAEWVAQRAD